MASCLFPPDLAAHRNYMPTQSTAGCIRPSPCQPVCGPAWGTVGPIGGESRKGTSDPADRRNHETTNRRREKEEQAGMGSQLQHILLSHEKKLCTDWLKVTFMSPLIFLLFLRFRTPGQSPSVATEPGNRKAQTPPVPAHSHPLDIASTILSSLHNHITHQSLRVGRKHSYFFT